MSTGYEVRLHRIGRWWAVDIPDASVHTQCRTLEGAEGMARDAISEALGIRPDTIAVELVVPEFASLLRPVLEARAHRAGNNASEQRALADAARTLVEDLHVSQSDAGRLLGLSHQEISQLSTPRGSADPRPWRSGSPPPPTAPALAPGSSPKRQRQSSAGRPSWAVAEDDT